jgi:MFS transporter, DHA1 family, multidrug resistance protein
VTALRHARWQFALLVAPLAMLAPFSLDTYLPSFPAMAGELQVSFAAMQSTLAVYLVAFAVSTLFAGPLSDAFGRRPVVIWALLGYALVSALLVISVAFWQVVALRIAQGAAAAAGVVVGRAIVRDRFDPDDARRVFALITMVFALGPAVAPMLGGWLQLAFGWRAVFAFLTLYGAVLAVSIWVWLPETLPPVGRVGASPVRILGRYLRAAINPQFLRPVLALALLFGALFVFIAASPVIIYEHMGGGEGDFWWLFAPLVLGLVAGGFAAGRLVGRLSPAGSVVAGLVLAGFALLGFLAGVVAGSPRFWLMLPLAGYSMAIALMMPALTLLALDCYPQARGMAAALQSFLQLGFSALLALFVIDWLATDMLRLAFGALTLWLLGNLIWFLPARARG